MSMQTNRNDTSPQNLWRSTAAVVVGFVAGAVLSLGTDQVLHVLDVYPPWGEPMYAPGLNLLALAYRGVYNVLGFYVVARLAPQNPLRHLWVGGAIGFVLSGGGVLAAMNANLGPVWYPVALALSTLPCAWIAAALHRKWHGEGRSAERRDIVPIATRNL